MRLIIYSILLFIATSCSHQHQLTVFDDYQEGIDHAMLNNNQVLLIFDFLGNPGNSVKENIYATQTDLSDLTIILLYVDKPDHAGRSYRKLQQNVFGSNFQPAYYLLDSRGNVMKGPMGYCDKLEFADFIKK